MALKLYSWIIGEIVSVRKVVGENSKAYIEVALKDIHKDEDLQDVVMYSYVNLNVKEYENILSNIGNYMAVAYRLYVKSDEKGELKSFQRDRSIPYKIFSYNPLDEKRE